MSEKAFKYCANCGQELGEEFYLFTDNFLQVKYFDSDECNAFCSEQCACEALMLIPYRILRNRLKQEVMSYSNSKIY